MHVIFGTGQLGQAVAAVLLAQGSTVRLVNRRGRVPGRFKAVEVIAGDLTDTASARHAASDASVIYHCAGAPYTDWPDALPALMDGAVDAAASTGARLIYGDNLYAYAPSGKPLSEGALERPTTRKGRVRKHVADILRTAHREGRIEAAIGRGSDFYGPWVTFSAVGREVFGRLAEGKAPRVLGDPDQPHSFTFIEDFARTLVVLAKHDKALGKTWHVPNAPTTATRPFAAAAAKAMGRDVKVQAIPSWLLRTFGLFSPMMKETAEMLYQWERPFVVDHTRFVRAFGDIFGAPTPLAEGISKTAAAFKTDSGPA